MVFPSDRSTLGYCRAVPGQQSSLQRGIYSVYCRSDRLGTDVAGVPRFLTVRPFLNTELLKHAMRTSFRTAVPVWSNYSCGAVIIPKQTAQTFPALHTTARAGTVSRLWEEQD